MHIVYSVIALLLQPKIIYLHEETNSVEMKRAETDTSRRSELFL